MHNLHDNIEMVVDIIVLVLQGSNWNWDWEGSTSIMWDWTTALYSLYDYVHLHVLSEVRRKGLGVGESRSEIIASNFIYVVGKKKKQDRINMLSSTLRTGMPSGWKHWMFPKEKVTTKSSE